MSVVKTNVTQFRSKLVDAFDHVANGDVVLVERRGHPNTALVDAELLEDFLAATNPRIIKKTAQARKEIEQKNTTAFKDIYNEVMGISGE